MKKLKYSAIKHILGLFCIVFVQNLQKRLRRPQHQTAAQPLTIHEDKRLNSKENAQGESGCAQEQEHTR